MKQDRSLLLYVLLSFVTFSVYHFYFMDLWAKDVNILCEKDGKHTVGVEKMMLFSVLTFGVYKYVWLAEIVDRICDNAAEYDVEVRQDSETFLVWMILVPVLGYLVAMNRAILHAGETVLPDWKPCGLKLGAHTRSIVVTGPEPSGGVAYRKRRKNQPDSLYGSI